MKRAHRVLVAATTLVPLLLVGCGSDSASSSSSAAAPASSEPEGALDREAALVEVGRQSSEQGFSEGATSCIVDWASTLDDVDLAVMADPDSTGTPELTAAFNEVIVSCARPEIIDLAAAGAAEGGASESEQACAVDYLNNLTDEELTDIMGEDEAAMTSFQEALAACEVGG